MGIIVALVRSRVLWIVLAALLVIGLFWKYWYVAVPILAFVIIIGVISVKHHQAKEGSVSRHP